MTGSTREDLEGLAAQAIQIAQTARKNRRPLTGGGFYATKFASLRTEAEIQFRALTASSSDGSKLRVLFDGVFGLDVEYANRVTSKHQFIHELKTEWDHSVSVRADDGLFPMSLLEKTRRGYLKHVGVQMNGAFNAGWYDAAAVMMRRLLETVIIEAFEANGLASKIKDAQGNFLQLTDLMARTLAEPTWNLGRDTKKDLPKLKDLGHWSAHNRRYTLQRTEIEKVRRGFRLALEELLRLAKLI